MKFMFLVLRRENAITTIEATDEDRLSPTTFVHPEYFQSAVVLPIINLKKHLGILLACIFFSMALTANALNFIAYSAYFCTDDAPFDDLTDQLSSGSTYNFASSWRYEYRYSSYPAIPYAWYVDGVKKAEGSELGGFYSSVTLTVVAPSWVATPGTHTLLFKIDPDNIISETDEGDNQISRTFTVGSTPASLTINPSSTNVSSSAASGRSIGVTANVSWTAVTNASWLAVTGGSSGTSNGTLTFSVATNAGTTARTGGVVVAGGGITRTCTVVQAGAAAALVINPSSTNVSSSAASGLSIGVTANVAWTTVTNASWLAVTGGSPGTSNGTVTFSVATNAGTTARTGGVVVAGSGISRTCTVVQAGAAASLAINPASTNVSSSAASGRSIGVTANVSWTAVTNASWLAVTAGSSGVSNGTVTFSVATNAGTTARTGGVIVAGGGISRTCTVVQAGAAVQRIIELSGGLAFGNVVTGMTKTATLTISNIGNSALTVTSIGYPSRFTGAWSGSIAAGNSTNVTVTFAPVALSAYGGTVTVNSDKTSGANTISASGTGTIWRLAVQYDEGFGVASNRFGFNLNWTSGRVVVVDACTNLINPVWSPLQTNTLSNTPTYFSDPKWTNVIGRFYRIRAP